MRTIVQHAAQEWRTSTLAGRAERAAEALQEAIDLVEEVQVELDARLALLGDVRTKLMETTRQVDDMQALGQVEPETVRIVNEYFDGALESRLGDLEKRAKSREVFLGTFVALGVGIAAILIAHYAFGF